MDWEKAEKGTEVSRCIAALAALRRRGELRFGSVRFSAQGGEFILRREYEGSALRLRVGKGRAPAAAGRVLLQYDCGKENGFSFIIEEESK